MNFVEHIKKGFLYSHVYFFIIVLVFILVLFCILLLLFRDMVVVEIFKPIFVFLVLWLIAILVLTLIVSTILAQKTRNPKYIYQLVGIVIFFTYIMIYLVFLLYIMFIPEPGHLSFPNNWYTAELIGLTAPVGMLMIILGYFGPYQGKAIRYSRNMVIREGMRIREMTDGYSKRPYSKIFGEIANLEQVEFNKVSRRFGRYLAYQGLILDWKIGEEKLELVPMKQLITDPDFFITNVRQVFNLLLKRKDVSKISIFKNGTVSAVISEKDYDEIRAPVAYHTLCDNVVEIFARAFIEYSKGNYYGCEKVFISGPLTDTDKPENFTYPTYLEWDKKDKNSAMWYIAFFVAFPITNYAILDFVNLNPDFYPNTVIPFRSILTITLVTILILIERRCRKVRLF